MTTTDPFTEGMRRALEPRPADERPEPRKPRHILASIGAALVVFAGVLGIGLAGGAAPADRATHAPYADE